MNGEEETASSCDLHGDCSCGCGHSHGHDHDGHDVREYVLLFAAGALLLAAIIGGYSGMPETAVAACAIISAALTGIPIIIDSLKGLLNGKQTVCELAGIAIVAAVLIGEYVTAAEVGFILSLGEIAENYAYSRSKRDIEKIADAHPDYGLVKRDGKFVEVPVDEIAVGDIVLVRPGDIVSSDGVVLDGVTSVDESCLTGESIPVEKCEGDPIYSGSVNQDGSLHMRVTKNGEDSTYSRIVNMVREAENRRPPSYPFIDRFASIYTPVTIAIFLGTWILTGSIERAITILIVACPCALLLSTPSAVISAIGAGARRGILIKSGIYLEEAGKTDTVLFDKTGTLTTGKMKVTSLTAYNNYSDESLLLAAAKAEHGSQHPVAKAITAFADEKGVEGINNCRASQVMGLGIKSESDIGTVLAGSSRLLADSGVDIPAVAAGHAVSLSGSGVNPVMISVNGNFAGILGLEDMVRNESPGVVGDLKNHGIDRVSVLTGDRQEIAGRVAKRCGVDMDDVYYEIAPGEKKSIVESLQQEGRTVCFVGDGINDGPALAQANLGVSIGSRENNVAIETSHVVLLRDDLRLLSLLINLGRKTVGTIKANVFFAISFTLALMVLAFFGFIHPAVGAVGHQIGTLIVLANSSLMGLKIRDSKRKPVYKVLIAEDRTAQPG